MENKEKTCVYCFKIICRRCQWEPSSEELLRIQKGELTSCPNCGWAPENIES